MFSYGPFFHTGLKAESVSAASQFHGGVTNPTDLRTATNMPKCSSASFLPVLNDKFKAWLNYQGGKFAEDGRLQQGECCSYLCSK